MLGLRSKIIVDDNTGVKLVYCIKILNSLKRKYAYLGEILLVVVKKIDKKKFQLKKHFKKFRIFRPGRLCRLFIIRTKFNFKRAEGAYVKFNQNAGTIVNLKNIPLTNRIKGPVIFEICSKNFSFGCISKLII